MLCINRKLKKGTKANIKIHICFVPFYLIIFFTFKLCGTQRQIIKLSKLAKSKSFDNLSLSFINN